MAERRRGGGQNASGEVPALDRDRTIGGIVGLCVGDALGLPVEYRSRSYLREDPVTGMIGFGTHNQPPGTWSSNCSLALCTVESLTHGFSLPDIAAQEGRWTPAGEPIDLPPPLLERIERLSRQEPATSVNMDGDTLALSVLSRTLPLAASLSGVSHEERFKRIAQVAALTNGSMRAVLGCFILVELALDLAGGHAPAEAYSRAKKRITDRLGEEPELAAYARLLEGDISTLSEDEIHTEGEIVHAVEAAVWCLLTQGDYRSVVLRAVNLGGATHTTASLSGALAGYSAGLTAVPKAWIKQLVRSKEIIGAAERLFEKTAALR